MKSTKGDIIQLALDGEIDVLIHGCNCFCTMGKGLALSIRSEFPEAYSADRRTRYGDESKLGSFSAAEVVRDGRVFSVVNAYTQYDWRGTGVKADYTAIEKAFTEIRARYAGKRIAYPMIGAGLAGGDWNTISGIIDRVLDGEDHRLVIYSPAAKPQGALAP